MIYVIEPRPTSSPESCDVSSARHSLLTFLVFGFFMRLDLPSMMMSALLKTTLHGEGGPPTRVDSRSSSLV